MLAKAMQLPVLGPVLAALRVAVLNLRSVLVLPWGLLRYRQTQRTPEAAYQAMVWLFCVSRGKFNDVASRLLARRRPKLPLSSRCGVLGDLDAGRSAPLVERLREDGYVVFPGALPAEACDRLMNFAQRTPALVRRMDHEAVSSVPRKALFDAAEPLAVRYDYDPADLLNHPDVQALLADGSLLEVVQEYLGCEPLADVLSMWWHTNYHTQPDAEAAQFFHFDMDRFKWLKIFIYLTDVGPENGPHAFVRGSHQTGAIPDHILRRGYVRLTDEEVAEHYPAKDVLAFSAPRGSIILEDTRGLHKGAHVTGAPRLILQLQFSNTLFGTNYPRARIGQVVAPELLAMLDRAPSIYRQYA
ncbi:phytanoyl-CoA dioxygenase family protein [Ideonella margarita]|uniref:Phytanoyl-CoA dioxygenase family protein n=1 Tax=Ideonella margarita TaxID=2984191 RepID=A0ABU9BZK6_9BURK